MKITVTDDAGVVTVFVPEVIGATPTETVHVKEGETVEIVADTETKTEETAEATA